MKNNALQIIKTAIACSLPYDNTKKILADLTPGDKVTVFSIGKAAVPMAQAAHDVLGDKIKSGLLVTKYDHTGDFSSPYFEVIEAAHPVADENSNLAARKALEIANALTENDTAIVLLSGGGSALFEESIVSAEKQREITKSLLASGAEIDEINAIRKRISLVKGGKFASACYPAKVITIALSDVLSNDKSVIASGITVPDNTTSEYVSATAEKYLPDLDEDTKALLTKQTEIKINNGGYYFAGDINSLCDGAKACAEELGYKTEVISRSLSGEARDRATEIVNSAKEGCSIYGGETIVTLRGTGRGGRNQEMALTAAILLKGTKGIVFASAGSDGTDGPTDAAGGIVDGDTYDKILSAGIVPEEALENNDSYTALKAAGALLITGATGTNVNDLTLIIKE